MANPFVKAWKYLAALFNAKIDEHADPKVQIQQAIEEARAVAVQQVGVEYQRQQLFEAHARAPCRWRLLRRSMKANTRPEMAANSR